jgi:hypothetical protein
MNKVDEFGEVFTPPRAVNTVLKMLDPSVWSDPEAIFVESGCGEGAFVLAIVKKRAKGLGCDQKALQLALNTTFGWDIQQENVDICRQKLLELVKQLTGNDEIFMAYARPCIWYQISQRDSLKDSSTPPSFDLRAV